MTEKTIKIIKDFDIAQIADSGQCFRLNKREDGSYSLIARERYLEIVQQEEEITFFCEENEFREIWDSYFDLTTDYGAFKAQIESKDLYMQNACAYGRGIRILRQELWEMVITFIISQQNNIPRIKKCVESLCRAYGEKRQISGMKHIIRSPNRRRLQVWVKRICVPAAWGTGISISERPQIWS